jgi:acyl carrier protein
MTSVTVPGSPDSGSYSAPEPQTVQERLARLWADTLQISPVGLHDDFFELGGDSLAAAELQAEMDREFGVEISATTLFLSPTIAELSQVIHGALTDGGRG